MKNESERYFSGAVWEGKVGYCRAIKRGSTIAVSGTTSMKDGQVWAPGDAFGQALRCFEIIKQSLEQLGASIEDVVRTRMFVTDIKNWEAVGQAHARVFGEHPPATSMYEVRSLIAPQLLVEIEADAVVN